MRKKLAGFLLTLMVAAMLAACGATNTPAPANPTAPSGAATTAPVSAATTAPVVAASATPVRSIVPTLPPVAAKPDETGVAPMPPLPAIPADAKKGGTLNVANSGSLHPTLHPNPINADATAARDRVAAMIWSQGLVDYNFKTLQWQLEMAKEVKVDTEGKVFTFTLRTDLKWSDGSPITIDDFQFAWDNASKENKENPAANFQRLQDFKLVTSYKSDAATNTITVTYPKAYARDLAYYFLNVVPMPKKVWEGKAFYDPATNQEIRKPTVVSGPYMIEEYDEKAQAILKKNPNWYRGQANFDQIIIKPYQPTVIAEALKAGQADVTFDALPPAQFADLKSNTNVDVYEWSGVQNDRRSIAFNTTAAPFNDKTLRQALLYAFDRAQMIVLAESGKAVPEYSIIYAASPYFNPEVTRYNFDLAKARQALTAAGYKFENNLTLGKDGQPFKFTLSFSSVDVAAKNLATYIQAQLKQLGIDVNVLAKDPQSNLTDLLTQKYDASLNFTGSGNFPDPDTLKTYYISTGVFNVMKYKDTRVDEIFNSANTELDAAKRKKLYDEAQVILTNDVPTVLLYSKGFYIAAGKKVGGIAPGKGGTIVQNYAVASWYFKS